MATDSKRLGCSTILHTEDGGQSWNAQGNPPKKKLLSVMFTDAKHGWAVGDMDKIFHTEDSGASWQMQSSGISEYVIAVTFINSQQGWAVGDFGTIQREHFLISISHAITNKLNPIVISA